MARLRESDRLPRIVMSKKNRKIRADFRKNRTPRQRSSDLTRRFEREDYDQQLDEPRAERISGKGELTRRRTVVGSEADEESAGFAVTPQIDLAKCRAVRTLQASKRRNLSYQTRERVDVLFYLSSARMVDMTKLQLHHCKRRTNFVGHRRCE